MTKITPPAEKTPWEVLSAVNLADKVEQKNGLSYISWAWAWGELKRHYPYAWFRKHDEKGYPCFHDIQGYAFVKVTVGLDRTGDHEVTEMLPVLDHRNKPIQGPNAFEVNNALQRCLAKAIAYLGLGHYIYAGEDLPPDVAGAGQEAPSGQAGGQVPPNPQTPPSGPSSHNAPTIFGPGGGVQAQSHSVDVITATFLAFIPTCTDEKMLTQFYSVNRGARDYLLHRDKEKHDTVIAAFSEAKKKFTAPTGDEKPTTETQA